MKCPFYGRAYYGLKNVTVFFKKKKIKRKKKQCPGGLGAHKVMPLKVILTKVDVLGNLLHEHQ